MIMTFTFMAPFPLLSNGALQQQLFNNLFHLTVHLERGVKGQCTIKTKPFGCMRVIFGSNDCKEIFCKVQYRHHGRNYISD